MESGDKAEGAGDQGLMFGYACRETDELMPAPIHYSHQILLELAKMRKADADSILGPDAKSQLTAIYDENGVIQGIENRCINTACRWCIAR